MSRTRAECPTVVSRWLCGLTHMRREHIRERAHKRELLVVALAQRVDLLDVPLHDPRRDHRQHLLQVVGQRDGPVHDRREARARRDPRVAPVGRARVERVAVLLRRDRRLRRLPRHGRQRRLAGLLLRHLLRLWARSRQGCIRVCAPLGRRRVMLLLLARGTRRTLLPQYMLAERFGGEPRVRRELSRNREVGLGAACRGRLQRGGGLVVFVRPRRRRGR